MKNAPPLSDDWLYWDPESIHCYPHTVDAMDMPCLKSISEKMTPRTINSKSRTWLSVQESTHAFTLGIVSGAVAGTVVTLLIVLLPNTP